MSNDNTALVESNPATLSFGDASKFEHIQRVATMFSKSQLVPPIFQNNIPNCVIGLEIAQRIGASPLMVFQNLNIIHGKPSFSATFMIATVNSCGRYTPLRFNWVGERGTDEWGCYASAKAKMDGAELKGTPITMLIAKKEGWTTRKDSKWPSMPDHMMMYRAATWWTRMYAPEILMGFPTADEVMDIHPLPTDIQIADPEPAPKREKTKGVAGMKKVEAAPDNQATRMQVAAVNPTHENISAALTPEKTVTEDAPAVLEKAAAADTVDADAGLFPEAKPLRCELVSAEERQAKKQSGVGPVTVVTFKGEYQGTAYYDGGAAALPGPGSLVDVVISEKESKIGRLKVLDRFTLVG